MVSRSRAHSSAGLERIPDKDEVRGSNPRAPTQIARRIGVLCLNVRASVIFGDVAQLGEHRVCNARVVGSSPIVSTLSPL